MNNLLAGLGLDKVEADPNAIPDNKYDGKILKDEFVIGKSNNTFAHVLTYKVTEGDYTGAERAEWFRLGTDPLDVNGQPTTNPSEVASYTSTMTEQNKQWYKKRLVDVGVTEDAINTGQFVVGSLKDRPVTFGTKKNGDFININFVELRTGAVQASPQVLGQTAQVAAPVTTQTAVPGMPATPQDISNLV